MNTNIATSAAPRSGTVSVALVIVAAFGLVLLALGIALVIGITGIFRLSSEASALRASVMESIPGAAWDKKIALRVGGFTTGLVRVGSRFFEMPPEPRAVLDSVRGAEVGIYQLHQRPRELKSGAALKAADRAMKSRGWDRIVGVATDRELVAVYCPQKISTRALKCCVLVFEGNDLVVASASGNLESLFELAREHFDLEHLKRQLHEGICSVTVGGTR